MSKGFVMPTKVGVGKHARKDYAVGHGHNYNTRRWVQNGGNRPDPTFLRILHDRFREGNFARRKDVVISAGNWSGRGAAIRSLRIGRTGDMVALDYQKRHHTDWVPVVKINLTTGLLYSITTNALRDISYAHERDGAGENLTNFLLAVRCVFFGDTHASGVRVISTRFIDWSQYGASVQPTTDDNETVFISFPDASGDLWYYTADFRLSAGQVGNLTCEPKLDERFSGYGVIYMPELGVNKRAGRFIAKGGTLPTIFRDYLKAVRVCLPHGETGAYDRYRRAQGDTNFDANRLEAVEARFAAFPLKRLTSPFGIYDLSISQRKPAAVLKAPKDYATELAKRYIPKIILLGGFTDDAAENERQHGQHTAYGEPQKTASTRALDALVMMMEARMHLPSELWEGTTEKIGTMPLDGTLTVGKDQRYYHAATNHQVTRNDLRKRHQWTENIFRKWVKRVIPDMLPILPLIAPAKGKQDELTFMPDGGGYMLPDLQKPVPNILDLLGVETKLTGANRRW